MSNWKNPAPDASPVRSPTDSVTMQIGETGGTETGEYWKAADEASMEYIEVMRASLAAEKLKVEGLERERVELSGQLKMAEARAESCENYCVPISNDGKSVFIDGPGDFEIDYDGWHARAEALEQRVAALVGALKNHDCSCPGKCERPVEDQDDSCLAHAALATEA